MKVEVNYVPTEKQKRFHACECDEALYGGAAGGGKSTALVMDAFMRAVRHPGLNAYLFRRTYGELNDTLIAAARRMIPSECGSYSAQTHDLRLKNGSALHFRNLHRESDKYAYQGVEINALYIDELTHFTSSMYEYLKTRLRANVSLGFKPVGRYSANPGGVGHAWVRARFVDCAKPGDEAVEETRESLTGAVYRHTRVYLIARAADNPHINPEYIFELERKPPLLRAALLNGDWNVFSGQAFPEWRDNEGGYATRAFTHVISPFALPAGCVITRAFDFGYARPFAVLWMASFADGRVCAVNEWYGASSPDTGIKLNPREIARGILQREREFFGGKPIYGVADPSIWDASRGESVAAQMEKEGVFFQPGQNARLAGKMQLHCRLSFDAEGKPGLYVFRTCRELIRTLPALTLNQANPEDVDTRCEDHAYDALRYYLMSVPVAPKTQKKVARPYNPLEDERAPRKDFLTL